MTAQINNVINNEESQMKKILIALTNKATLGDTEEANGTYAPELTHALAVFLSAGYEYDFVSINGGIAPLYGTDIEDDAVNQKILVNEIFQQRIKDTKKVETINAADYDAIFYPGGFGLLSDLATHSEMAKISATHYESNGIISAVCHGPAGLLPIQLSNGKSLLEDKKVTGFTREEEIDFGTINKIPFLLEESLARKAAQFSKVQPWQVFVIEDNRVITGQNPASAHLVAQKVVNLLNK